MKTLYDDGPDMKFLTRLENLEHLKDAVPEAEQPASAPVELQPMVSHDEFQRRKLDWEKRTQVVRESMARLISVTLPVQVIFEEGKLKTVYSEAFEAAMELGRKQLAEAYELIVINGG